LYQPARSGSRLGTAFVTFGGVASYLNGKDLALEFPARSVQEPLRLAESVSGPEYPCGAVQESVPDVASVAAKPTVRGALYQVA
jgi:hypothetical protein